MLSIKDRFARRCQARDVALALMAQHNLVGWTFAFNRRKRSLGLCRYQERVIELSIHLVQRNDADEIRDTILHEIAHALVGADDGHGPRWKAKCRDIGARPERCADADMPPGRWQARCLSCASIDSRHRRPRDLRGWYCRSCGPEHGKLMWQGPEKQ
jgi:predicted SprT family Zn-dependent metalloprotease